MAAAFLPWLAGMIGDAISNAGKGSGEPPPTVNDGGAARARMMGIPLDKYQQMTGQGTSRQGLSQGQPSSGQAPGTSGQGLSQSPSGLPQDPGLLGETAYNVSDPYALDANAYNIPGYQDWQDKIAAMGGNQSNQANVRNSQGELGYRLMQQANGQGPSLAQNQLQSATDQNIAQQMALAQSQAGGGNAATMRNAMQNSAGIQQQMANQSAGLRMQEQMNARQQLGGLLGGMRGQDQSLDMNRLGLGLQTARDQRAGTQQYNQDMANQRLRYEELQHQAFNDAAKGRQNEFNGWVQAGVTGLKAIAGSSGGGNARGGEIQGHALFPGDSEANDIVPTMLSPHEIVIPRSIAQSPNAPEEAAAFVAALKRRNVMRGKGGSAAMRYLFMGGDTGDAPETPGTGGEATLPEGAFDKQAETPSMLGEVGNSAVQQLGAIGQKAVGAVKGALPSKLTGQYGQPESPRPESQPEAETTKVGNPNSWKANKGVGTEPPPTKSAAVAEGVGIKSFIPAGKYEKQLDDASTDRSNAMTRLGGVQADEAKEEAGVREQAAKDSAAAEVYTKDMNVRHMNSLNEDTGKLSRLLDKYANASIDPNHYWANLGTGGTILAGIGLALGAMGARADGVNRAAQVINTAIDRDIDAQKANISKLGQAVSHGITMHGIMRENYKDENMADSANKIAAMQVAANNIAAIQARAKGPEQQANLQMLSAEWNAKIAEKKQEFAAQADARASTKAFQSKELELRELQVMAAIGRGAKGANPAAVKAKEMAARLLEQFEKVGKEALLQPKSGFSGTEAQKYEKMREAYLIMLSKGARGSARVQSEAEINEFGERRVPHAKDWKPGAHSAFDALADVYDAEAGIAPSQEGGAPQAEP